MLIKMFLKMTTRNYAKITNCGDIENLTITNVLNVPIGLVRPICVLKQPKVQILCSVNQKHTQGAWSK